MHALYAMRAAGHACHEGHMVFTQLLQSLKRAIPADMDFDKSEGDRGRVAYNLYGFSLLFQVIENIYQL